MKNVLLYFALFFLIVLLLLPPGLRLFGKNLYQKNNEEKKVVELLSCNRPNETISSTFLNSVPQNFQYKIKGNYFSNETESEKTGEESKELGDIETEKEDEKTEDNKLIYDIQKFALVNYDSNNDISIFTIELNKMGEIPSDLNSFKTIVSQKEYLESLGFACIKSTF